MSFVGAIVALNADDQVEGVGCCFAHDGAFITADHIIEAAYERGFDELYVVGPGLEPAATVESIIRHPTADLAVLHVPGADGVESFADIASPEMGEAATVYGFGPAGPRVMSVTVGHPAPFSRASTPKTRGTSPAHLRRTSTDRLYTYPSVTLSENCGHGFSGGPICTDTGLIGVFTYGVRLGRFEWGGALRLDAVMPWIGDTINNRRAAA